MTRFLTFIASLFIRALHATLRVRHVRAENIERLPQYIIAFWHAHLLLMVRCRFRKPISVMISQSKDGELIAGTMRWFGVDAARGSSSRNSLGAMRELIRTARSGANIVFTPDGPRGPSRVSSEGVVYAAELTGLPIVPIAFNAKKKSCCARGTASSSRARSRKPSSCTARPSTLNGIARLRQRGFECRMRSMRWSARARSGSMRFGVDSIVIPSEARDLRLRNLRFLAVFAARNDRNAACAVSEPNSGTRHTAHGTGREVAR